MVFSLGSLERKLSCFFTATLCVAMLTASLVYFCHESRVLKTKKILRCTGNHNI